MRSLTFLLFFALSAPLVLGCNDDMAGPDDMASPGPGPVDVPGTSVGSIVLQADADTVWMAGTTQLHATVLGLDGDTLTGETVTFASSSENIITVSNTGLVTGAGPGAARVTARAGDRAATITVFVRLGVIAIVSGDNQKGNPGRRLDEPLVVRVTDAQGDGVGMVSLWWSVALGAGTLEAQSLDVGKSTGGVVSTVTDRDGFAEVRFTPSERGRAKVLVAAGIDGIQGTPVTFTTVDDLSPLRGGVLIYERAGPQSAGTIAYHGSLSERYVLYEDGTFGLQFTSGRYGFFEYPGSYSIRDELITFDFDDDSRWQATGRIRGDRLSVEYNLIMYLSDFEDGVYIRSRG